MLRNLIRWGILLVVVAGSATRLAALDFRRGDCNGDSAYNIADPIALLMYLFPASGLSPGSGFSPACMDACDSNDDGILDLGDVIAALQPLHTPGIDPPPPPGPQECGPDPTDDTLGCDSYDACP